MGLLELHELAGFGQVSDVVASAQLPLKARYATQARQASAPRPIPRVTAARPIAPRLRSSVAPVASRPVRRPVRRPVARRVVRSKPVQPEPSAFEKWVNRTYWSIRGIPRRAARYIQDVVEDTYVRSKTAPGSFERQVWDAASQDQRRWLAENLR